MLAYKKTCKEKSCHEFMLPYLPAIFDYRMTQFFGSPQGPLSFSAGSSVSNAAVGFCVVFGVAFGPVDASLAAPDPAPFAVVAAPSPATAPASSFFFSPLDPSSVAPSSQKLTLLTVL
jgi:hypothetical protein